MLLLVYNSEILVGKPDLVVHKTPDGQTACLPRSLST